MGTGDGIVQQHHVVLQSPADCQRACPVAENPAVKRAFNDLQLHLHMRVFILANDLPAGLLFPRLRKRCDAGRLLVGRFGVPALPVQNEFQARGADADFIAVLQFSPLGDLFSVHRRAVAAAAVADPVNALFDDNLRVLPGGQGLVERQVALGGPADDEHASRDRDLDHLLLVLGYQQNSTHNHWPRGRCSDWRTR